MKEIFNLAKQNQENHIKGEGQLTEINIKKNILMTSSPNTKKRERKEIKKLRI